MLQGTGSWFLLSLLLAVFSVGFLGVIKLIACLALLLSGAVIVAYAISEEKPSETSGGGGGEIKTEERQCWLPHRHAYPPTVDPVASSTARLTGIPQLDEEINEILGHVFRDNVLPWQTELTHSNVFTLRVQESIRVAIAVLSERVRQVDWIPFLTTRLVNDVASHVRLFKKARLLLKTRIKDESSVGKISDLESAFFDCEVSMEEGAVCRDVVSNIHQDEINFLQDVTELLLFQLLPQSDFGGQSLRTLTREILVNSVIKPSLDMLSDPDFLNQTIVWLHQDYPVKSELFTQTVRLSESLEELQATRELATREICILRQNDSKSESDSSLKQQLSSLLYMRKAIDARIHRLQSGSESDSIGLPAQIDWNQMIGPGLKLFSLPMEVVLKSNIALSFFIDFMSSIGCQAYIFFYLNIEGWKVSAEQHLMSLFETEEHIRQQQQQREDPQPGAGLNALGMNKEAMIDNMREAAHSIYEEYLSEKANPRLKLDDDSAVKRLIFKIRTEPPDPDWFSEVQDCVYNKLQSDERFFESFKKSMGYVKLLAELDLLKDPSNKAEEEDNVSLGDEFSIYDNASLNSYEEETNRHSRGSSVGADLSEMGVEAEQSPNDLDATLTNKTSGNLSGDSGIGGFVKSHRRMGSDSLQRQKYAPAFKRGHTRNASQTSLSSQLGNDGGLGPILQAEISEVAMRSDKGSKSFAAYSIVVKSRDARGADEGEKVVLRRYSEFYSLNELVSNLFPALAKLTFPSKKTFGNTQKEVLEKRKAMLHSYLQELVKTETLQNHPGLLDHLQRFLDPNTNEDNSVTKVKTANVAVKAVKSVGQAVTSAPGAIINTVDNVVDGIFGKAFQSNHRVPTMLIDSHPYRYGNVDPFSTTVANNTGVIVGTGAAGNTDSVESNIPLRIILLFMDEVFDLQERNQWLRRQIVAVLRQILKAMFGDIVNRRIVDYFAAWTAPSTLASYLRSLKDSLWPNGYPAETKAPRDEATKMRTRIAAKVAMFSSLNDELKRVIGSETSRAGLMMLFDMLQHPVLNKRLTIVLLEAVLDTIFAEQDLPAIFQKLHSRSGRVKNELRNSQRKHSDLRVMGR